MANMTRTDVEKINARLSNGWKFDLWHFMTHQGDKTTKRVIKVGDSHCIIAQLWFDEVYKNFRREGLEIVLNISYWEIDENGTGKSWGLGLFRSIPYNKTRKSFADIEKLTAVIDDDYIMKIYNEGDNSKKCLNGIILDKGGWKINRV